MIIKRLNLAAVGPFTDKTFDFNSKKPGLHIVFGNNEAGKSSSLRALKAWLYGFAEQTNDNFVHSYPQLLVGGVLRNSKGEELAFFRRKRRKADILDQEGNPLDPKKLAPFLHGIEQGAFESLYGLDHQTLIKGGEDILAQKGEVGQAIFAAGEGIESLKSVLDSLNEEAELLFKSKGSKQIINKSLAEYKALEREIKEASLSGQNWLRIQKERDDADLELIGVENEKLRREKELTRARLLKRAMPHLAIRQKLIKDQQLLHGVVALPDDFGERRVKIERELYAAKQQRDELQKRFEYLKEIKGKIIFSEEILLHEGSISDIYQQAGSYQNAMQQKPKLEGIRISCRREAKEYLRQISAEVGLENIEILRPVLAKRKLILALAAKHETILLNKKHAEKDYQKLVNESQLLDSAIKNLPGKIDVSGLEMAVAVAGKAGNIDEQIDLKQSKYELGIMRLAAELNGLGLWKGKIENIVDLQLPLPETVGKYIKHFQDLEASLAQWASEGILAGKELDSLEAQLEELELIYDVPTEEQLVEVREKRQTGWHLLRKKWQEGEVLEGQIDEFTQGGQLIDVYEKLVVRADDIADRLRREADRSHKFASLKVNRQRLEIKRTELAAKMAEIQDKLVCLQGEWQKLWEPTGITPLSAKEMAGWLTAIDKIKYQTADYLDLFMTIKESKRQRTILADSLKQQLARLGGGKSFDSDNLSPLLLYAESVLARIKQEDHNREKLVEKRKDILNNLLSAKEFYGETCNDLAEWQKSWKNLALTWPGDFKMMPEEAADIMDNIQSCFAKIKEAEDLQKRVSGIDRDADNLKKRLDDLLSLLSFDFKDTPIQITVSKLHGMLNEARENKTLVRKYDNDIKRTQEEIIAMESSVEGLEGRQKELCRLAGCENPQELEEAERLFAKYQKISTDLEDLENILLLESEGLTIAELEAMAKDVDPEELPGTIERLQDEIEVKLGPRIKALSELIGEKRREMQELGGKTTAMVKAEEAASLLAKINRKTERYLHLKLAVRLLNIEIEKYRAANQDPILGIASGYFNELTLGSFTGLRTDENDNGQQIIVGLREDRSRVAVEEMSSGTRDQLYLALRLASLERRLQIQDEVMPFIVDDILINFDDRRSVATLKLMAEIAKDVQIIMFTHHERIIEAVAEIGKDEIVKVHQI